MDLKETATQLVNEAHSEVLARYTEAEINEHIANIKSLLEMFNDITSNWSSAFPSVSYTLEQMLENLEHTKLDLDRLETQSTATRKALFDALRKIRKLEKQLKEHQS